MLASSSWLQHRPSLTVALSFLFLSSSKTHSVPHVPGVDLTEYKKNLISRFSNPYVKDKVERLMLDGSKKLPNTMRDAIIYLTKEGIPTTYLGIAVAAYIRYVTGINAAGEEIPVILDPMAEVR